VVGESGENLGVLSRDEAVRIAKEKGLDLVLVAAQANPPVARIVSFDKFRYEKSKELKKQKVAQKALEMKQIQVSVREAANDMARKAKRIDEFLNEGHKIEIQLTLRGREKSMEGFAREKFNTFLKLITTPYKLTQDIQRGARGLLAQLSKDSRPSNTEPRT
jgi:translation initiation factor IF-3